MIKLICSLSVMQQLHRFSHFTLLLAGFELRTCLAVYGRLVKIMRSTRQTVNSSHSQLISCDELTGSRSSHGPSLESVTAEKDLGIWISHDLKASQQCIQAHSKVNKCKDVGNLLCFYKSLIRPHLESCTAAWSSHTM